MLLTLAIWRTCKVTCTSCWSCTLINAPSRRLSHWQISSMSTCRIAAACWVLSSNGESTCHGAFARQLGSDGIFSVVRGKARYRLVILKTVHFRWIDFSLSACPSFGMAAWLIFSLLLVTHEFDHVWGQMADILRHAACEVLLSDKAPLFEACHIKLCLRLGEWKLVMLGWMGMNFLFIKGKAWTADRWTCIEFF